MAKFWFAVVLTTVSLYKLLPKAIPKVWRLEDILIRLAIFLFVGAVFTMMAKAKVKVVRPHRLIRRRARRVFQRNCARRHMRAVRADRRHRRSMQVMSK